MLNNAINKKTRKFISNVNHIATYSWLLGWEKYRKSFVHSKFYLSKKVTRKYHKPSTFRFQQFEHLSDDMRLRSRRKSTKIWQEREDIASNEHGYENVWQTYVYLQTVAENLLSIGTSALGFNSLNKFRLV